MTCKICKQYYNKLRLYDSDYVSKHEALLRILVKYKTESTTRKNINENIKRLNRICANCINTLHRKLYEIIIKEIKE